MPSKNTIIKLILSKKIYLFGLLILVGVLLLSFASEEGDSKVESASGIEELDPDKYAERVAEQVEELCNKIDGVSGAYAVVTLKGGYQATYATDSQISGSTNKNQTVIIGSGSNEQAILRGYRYPEIAGIGIVCNGGDGYAVKNKIVTLISSTFNLSTNKIFVVGS